MTFEDYLLQKKINAGLFQQHEPELYLTWKSLFAQMHPESFTSQKKFLLNDLRRKYIGR